MKGPEVTLVVTTRDRPELARRAVESALRQSLRGLEVVVVDDGSREPFRFAGVDPRVRVMRIGSSRGVCAARNLGLSAARGRWISFLDDDDRMAPTMLEDSLRAAERSVLPPPVAVLSGVRVEDENGRCLEIRLPPRFPKGKRYFLEDPRGRSFQVHNSLVAPTQLLRDIGGWDEEIRSAEHDDLFLKLNASCSIEAVDDVAYLMTAHASSRLSTDVLARAQGHERTLRKHRETFARHPRQYALYLSKIGVLYLRAGRWRDAVSASSRSIVRDPWRAQALVWWVASLAGPKGLSLYRWGRGRLRALLAD